MHMADALLSPVVGGVMTFALAGGAGLIISRVKKKNAAKKA